MPHLVMPTLLLALVALSLMITGCTSDIDVANEAVRESDSLRTSAVEKLRKSTATMDGLVQGAAAGKALPATQTKIAADAAVADLNKALAELTARDQKLGSAQELGLNANYQEYLRLLRESNDKLRQTVSSALEIPELLQKEQYSLAGWDEIKTQAVVKQIYSIQQNIEKLNGESETRRNQAEKLRQDHPEDFGE
ncbi:MAG: hypothetical protein ACYDGS_00575 [Thermoleophilia bacterium]